MRENKFFAGATGRAAAAARRVSIRRRFVRIMTALLAAVMVLSCISCAEDAQLKTVRVAMDDSGIVVKIDPSGKACGGYGYEYIQTIASYAGWEVEYVYCGSFSEALQAVIDGEADLYYDISYTKEREALLLYPDTPMGTETYYLYSLAGNTEITADDPATFNGKTVGVTAGTVMVDLLEKWCGDNQVTLTVREFESTGEEMRAFENGETDLEFQVNTLAGNQYSALVKVADSDYYLVANKGRADLIDDINSACETLEGINPFFVTDLEEKYFSASVVTRTLSKNEKAWLDNHDTLSIGYMDDYLPFSDKAADGSPDGIIKDIVPALLGLLGIDEKLSVVYVGYTDSNDMIAALKSGEVDAVFPVCAGFVFSANNRISESYPVIDLTADLIYSGVFSDDKTTRIAVDRNNIAQQYYTTLVYPNAELVYCDSIYDAIRSVLDGNAGSTILNGLRTDLLLSGDSYQSLKKVRLLESFGFSFAVASDNTALLSLLDRSITGMDDGFASGYVYRYIGTQQLDAFTDFVSENKETLIAIAFLIVLLIGVSAVVVAGKLRRNGRKLEKTLSEVEALNVLLADYARVVEKTGYGMWRMFFKEGAAPRARANDKMKELLGIKGRDLAEEEIYRHWHDNILPEDLPAVLKHFEKQLSGQFSEVTYRWLHPEKGVTYVRCGGVAEKSADGTVVLSGYHSDITEMVLEKEGRQNEIKELNKRILVDALTGANNRNAIDRYLSDHIIGKDRDFCLAMIDADHFKEINDTYGHPVGDRALQLLAKSFMINLTEHVFFARYGGDEFLLIDTSADPGSLRAIAQKARASLKEMCERERVGFVLDFSCGIVLKTKEMKTISDILKAADAEMYRIKKEKHLANKAQTTSKK